MNCKGIHPPNKSIQFELKMSGDMNKARTVAVNTFVFVELVYLFNCRSLSTPFFAMNMFSNLWVPAGACTMLIIQVLYTYLPQMNRIFSSAPIGTHSWFAILISGLLVFAIIEAEKRLRQGWQPKH